MAEPSTQAETAANFGYTLAFFNSNPELKKLLSAATAGQWTPGRFVAALQNTKWFRTTSESYRKYQALRSSDPATFSRQLDSGQTHVQNLGESMGATVTIGQARHLADQAMKFGWTEDQIKRQLVGFLNYDKKTGRYGWGAAAAAQQQYRAMAEDYGVDLSDYAMQRMVRSSVIGGMDATSAKNYIQSLAASKYVALKDRIMAGESVRQIADPYMQSYAKLLEVDGENVKLDDPLIQRALQARDAKGKPTTQTVYDFEQTLRNDARWRKTDNARDTGMAAANAILKMFGKLA